MKKTVFYTKNCLILYNSILLFIADAAHKKLECLSLAHYLLASLIFVEAYPRGAGMFIALFVNIRLS
jgi:hypothetical protein